MRRSPLWTALALVGLLVAAPAAAFIIYLKDGSQLVVRERYRVEGDMAIVVMPSGVTSSMPLADIDVERTERENDVDYGTARKLDGLERVTEVDVAPPEEDRSSLASLLRRRGDGGRQDVPAARGAEPVTVADRRPRTAGGYVDLLAVPRVKLTDSALTGAMEGYLTGQGLASAAVFAGTSPRTVLVEVVANVESRVFQAVVESANALIQVREQFPDTVDAVELVITADSGRQNRAGQFLLTPELAELLTSGTMSPPAFFFRYVEF